MIQINVHFFNLQYFNYQIGYLYIFGDLYANMQRLIIGQLCVVLLQNLNWVFGFSFLLVSLFRSYHIFDLLRQSMYNNVEEELGWLGQRECDIGEDIEGR